MNYGAICLRGSVSKINGLYVNYAACYDSIIKHIVNINKNYHFDFFIHSWNQDLKENLISLYKPKQYLFENNLLYKNEIDSKLKSLNEFNGISAALSMKKSIELLNDNYDFIISYRPDVILLKDINLSTYNYKNIYVNGKIEPTGWTGDFHFIMNCDNALKFKELYNSINKGNVYNTHYWIYNYVINFLKQEILGDNIIPGIHQEVLRKIYSTTIQNFNVPIENLLQYGLTKEEIITYKG